MEKIGIKMYDSKEKHNYIKLSPYNSDGYENIDSLDIRPIQVKKSHKSASRSKKREYNERHRDTHSRKHYDDESKRDDKHLDRRKHRSRHHYYNDDRVHHKENKGDLLGSRHSDPCKYDVKHSKDYKRHSHRHSESHRRYNNDYYYSKKYNNIDNSNIKVGDEFESKHSKRYRCDINDDEVEEVVESKKPRVEEIEEETEKGEFPVDEDLSDWESDQDTLNKNNDDSNNSTGNNSSNSDEESTKSEGKDVDKEEKSEDQNHDNVVDEEEEEKDLQNDSIVEFDENLPPYYPALQGCRSVEEFQCLNRIEEGTYGVVYRFKDKRTNEIVALKRLKMEREREGFPITSLREINTLLKSQHPNIVTVREIVVGSHMDKIYIVMDYVEHDLKSLIELMKNKHQKFLPGEIKCLLKQLLAAVAHLHDNWILHRDLKTSNLLLSHQGILKVGDFGLAREYGSPLKPYTPIVVTLWYRAPELLLGTKQYSTPIDMWSVGCIFAELVLMHPLFTGKSEIEQLHKFFKFLGTPNDKIWPGFNKFPVVQKLKFPNHSVSNLRKRFRMLSDFGVNLLTSFLTYDPNQRITAEEALKHPYFFEFPQCIEPSQFPKWPAKSELGYKKPSSPKAPSGGGEFKKLGDEDGFRIGTEEQNSRLGGGFFLKF